MKNQVRSHITEFRKMLFEIFEFSKNIFERVNFLKNINPKYLNMNEKK
jgi:hypothetical protein